MDVFAMAERAEVAVAEIYTLLSDRFKHDADLRALFGLLAEEERGHARQVQQVAAAWRADGNWKASAELLRIVELAEKAEALLATLCRQKDLSGQQAITLAARLENDFNDVHAHILAGDEAPALRDLFSKLAEHDHGHRELFERLRVGTVESSPAANERRATAVHSAVSPSDETT